MTSMLLFLIFFPRNPQPSEMDEQDANIPTWKEAVLVLAVSLTFFIVALFGSVIFVYAASAC
jgi:LPS O-antigen subunit length determinant protein (WzzB/FepE family)